MNLVKRMRNDKLRKAYMTYFAFTLTWNVRNMKDVFHILYISRGCTLLKDTCY